MKDQFNQARLQSEGGSPEGVEAPRAVIEFYLERAAEHLEARNPAAAIADTIRAVDIYAGIDTESRIPDAKLDVLCPLKRTRRAGGRVLLATPSGE